MLAEAISKLLLDPKLFYILFRYLHPKKRYWNVVSYHLQSSSAEMKIIWVNVQLQFRHHTLYV